jgi:hypothetical protein
MRRPARCELKHHPHRAKYFSTISVDFPQGQDTTRHELATASVDRWIEVQVVMAG